MPGKGASWSSDDLIGGHPCLDLVNTAGGTSKCRDRERLHGFADLAAWSATAGLITEAESRVLLGRAEADRAAAAREVEAVRVFREDLHAVLLALAARQAPPEDAWSEITASIAAALAVSRLDPHDRGYRRVIPVDEGDPKTVLMRAALAAEDLLTSPALATIRNCDRCSWLYLDRSRGRRRRWCSMRYCGNRAKVQRFARRKAGG